LIFIVPFILILFLEFIIEPLFKVRQRIINRFGSIPTGITAMIVTFFIWYWLIQQYPTVDERIFTFSMVGIMVYFVPKNYEEYKIKKKAG
jgi:Kef-type K+ transport system membrane component KefB